jgi:ribosomal protein S12 methylthiotransferase
MKIIVTGCLSQRYYESLKEEIPELDGFLGVENFQKVAELLNDETKDISKWKPSKSGSFLYDHTTPRIMSTPPYQAYLKIAEGCSHTCTFCAIPVIRGDFKSRTPESIILEAKEHASKGVKELILISQDTSYWGRDLEKKYHLATLLEDLNKIEGLEWIRLLYFHPDEITDHLLKTMAELAHVVNYVDIPLQHVNPRILKLMGRGYKTDFRKLIKKIRDIFDDDVAIRTTFLVGFPSETDEEFEEILEFLDDAKLDRVTAFPYSDEDGTEAFNLPDKLHHEIARVRYETLMEHQSDISFAINEGLIGKILKVLVEGTVKKEGVMSMVGRSYRDAPEIDGVVIFRGIADIGEFIDVEITDARDYDLIGEAVQD